MESMYGFVILWAIMATTMWAILYMGLRDYKADFITYKMQQQKYMTLYIEAARHNREIIAQNRNLRNAIATEIFYPKSFNLAESTSFNKKYEIEPLKAYHEMESSKVEVEHFEQLHKDDTRYSHAILS